MNNEINANLKNLEERINKSNIDDYYKKVLYKMLQTILLSKKCRIYTQNTSNYKEYIALRDQPGDLEQDLSFCVVKRLINEYDGSTASRSYEFYSYPELIKYYQRNRAVIDLEMAIATKDQNQNTPKSDSIITNLIDKANTMTNIPSKDRTRAINVLSALEKLPRKKFFIIKEDDYEEYITIRNNSLTVGRRMIDYAGATAGITYMPIDLTSFIYYLDAHKDKLGEENTNDSFTL